MKPLLPSLALLCLVALPATALAQASTTAKPAPPAAPAAKAATPAAAPAAATKAPATTADTPASPAGSLAAETVVVCTDVQDRAPVSAGESFASNVGTLCCFSKITGAETGQIYHRWYVGDKMVAEIPIPVKAASWRCWSRKTVQPSWQGECRVDVATESGDVLASAKFTLTSGGAAPTAATPQG